MEHYSLKKHTTILPFLAFGGAIAAICMLLLLLPTQSGLAATTKTLLKPEAEILNTNTITIGVAADLSQAIPDVGWPQVNSVQLAVDQVNAAGGISIGGIPHTVVLEVADSQCNSAGGAAAANTLVGKGVVAVVGHTCSSSSLGAQPIYAALDIPMVSGSSTNPQLTDGGFANTFRVITRDDTAMNRLATYLYKHLGRVKISIIDMPSSPIPYTNIFSTTYDSLGGVIASYYALGSSADFVPTIQAIATQGVDAIYFSSADPAEAGLFSLTVDQQGLVNTPVVWFPNNLELDLLGIYLATAGPAAEGDMAILNQRDKEQMPGYLAYNSAYVAAAFPNYGSEGQAWGAYAYDAAQFILNAIAAANSVAPDAVRLKLHEANAMLGVVDQYAGFDNKGDIQPQVTWFGSVRGGDWLQLAPVGLATDGPTVNDNGWNEFVYQGFVRAESENLVISYVYTSTDSSAYQSNLELCAADGNELCLAVGFMMGEAAGAAAANHPGENFAVLDGGVEPYPSNLRMYDFAEDEAGYLAGTLAGLMTQSDVVSAVGGLPVPAVVDFVESYAHAAVCANPSASAIISYTTSFIDPAQGAQVAADQMALGSDVVFGAGGSTGNGAILYATQNDTRGIGVDTDQYLTLYESGAVAGAENLLSSAMKKLDNAAYDAILDTIAEVFTGGFLNYNLAQDGVGLAPFHETDTSIPTFYKLWLDVIRAKLISGELTTNGACLTPQIVFLPAALK